MTTLNDKINILCKDLRESEGTRKQNYSSLASKEGSNEIKTYCALGALGCIKRMVYIRNHSIVEPNYSEIINAYGLSDALVKKTFIPYKSLRTEPSTIQYCNTLSLSYVIVNLNDGAHYKFGEIATIIKGLHDNGFITECTREEELNALKNQRELNNEEIIQKYNDMPDLA